MRSVEKEFASRGRALKALLNRTAKLVRSNGSATRCARLAIQIRFDGKPSPKAIKSAGLARIQQLLPRTGLQALVEDGAGTVGCSYHSTTQHFTVVWTPTQMKLPAKKEEMKRVVSTWTGALRVAEEFRVLLVNRPNKADRASFALRSQVVTPHSGSDYPILRQLLAVQVELMMRERGCWDATRHVIVVVPSGSNARAFLFTVELHVTAYEMK